MRISDLFQTAKKRVGTVFSAAKTIRLIAFAAALALGLGVFSLTQMLKHRGPKLVALPSGLQYIDVREGLGVQPLAGQTVIVHYVGTLESGQQFDSSYDNYQAASFRIGVGHLITGWEEGVMTMKVGGKRKLIIPPSLAYGTRGNGSDIPGNATLIFEVELLDLKQDQVRVTLQAPMSVVARAITQR